MLRTVLDAERDALADVALQHDRALDHDGMHTVQVAPADGLQDDRSRSGNDHGRRSRAALVACGIRAACSVARKLPQLIVSAFPSQLRRARLAMLRTVDAASCDCSSSRI